MELSLAGVIRNKWNQTNFKPITIFEIVIMLSEISLFSMRLI